MDLQEELDIIKSGTAEIISEEELKDKLKHSRDNGRPLRIKLGLDPSAPDIHLGHTVVLHKLRQFQELGHHVVLIIGDFTGRIGDPSGKSETRKQLTEEEVKKNAETYRQQIFKILDNQKTEVVFNSHWLSKLIFEDVLELGAKYSVARMLERDDFESRYKEGKSIGIHEFFYPLMQGYDSVAVKSDVEIGGTDQKFNLLVGRTIQRYYNQEPQIIMTMPILEGLDGKEKMSKSLENYIGINEDPSQIYGKAMSIPDELMPRYFQLVTDFSTCEVSKIARELGTGKLHPRRAKAQLAHRLVAMYYDNEAANAAAEEFDTVFKKGDLPDDIPERVILNSELENGAVYLPKTLKEFKMAPSTSQAKRLINQGAVRINDERVSSETLEYSPSSGDIIKVGKRNFVKVTVK